MPDNILKTALLVLGSLATGTATAQEERAPFQGCPVMIPVISASVSVETAQLPDRRYRYNYRVSNDLGSDVIPSVDLLALPPKTHSKFPPHWLPLDFGKAVSWTALTPYSGKSEVLTTGSPSDDNIAPGGTQSGFVLESEHGPGLVLYQLGSQRSIDKEMAAFTAWSGVPAPGKDATNDDYESWAEEYSAACGGNSGRFRALMVTGVVSGPSRFPTVPLTVIRDAKGHVLSFQITPPLSLAKAIADSSTVSLYNAETNSKMPITPNLLRNPLGLPIISFQVQPAVSSTFSCRSSSILADVITDQAVVMRFKIDGADLGLPKICSR